MTSYRLHSKASWWTARGLQRPQIIANPELLNKYHGQQQQHSQQQWAQRAVASAGSVAVGRAGSAAVSSAGSSAEAGSAAAVGKGDSAAVGSGGLSSSRHAGSAAVAARAQQSPLTPPTGLAPFRTTITLTAGLGQLRPYDDNHRSFLANSGRTVNDLRLFGPTLAELFLCQPSSSIARLPAVDLHGSMAMLGHGSVNTSVTGTTCLPWAPGELVSTDLLAKVSWRASLYTPARRELLAGRYNLLAMGSRRAGVYRPARQEPMASRGMDCTHLLAMGSWRAGTDQLTGSPGQAGLDLLAKTSDEQV
ncbi:hypothetical protein PCANC_23388 [Puccinia coronata f. sp. avenae]|uniref:Uncharacterized protein n=1 Tax=Puccinia coronata f. sp. avenae TaxID=200324 RepID=A0A2N5SGL9_9BASI|nr:hypothetical protein PCANC_23388 [Puccinia coronata f. sp. avenae]